MRGTPQRNCACGRHYEPDQLDELPLFARLTEDEVSAIATPWPAHLVVEVRICDGCERLISRLADAAPRAAVTELEAFAA